jgi:hypothetical protein
MMIPFNEIYSIARERDNEIRQASNPEYGQSMQQPELRRTIADFLQRLLGNRPAPADAAWAHGTEPGR